MKVAIERTPLMVVLDRLSKVLPTGRAVPMLANAKVSVGEVVSLTATDMSTSLTIDLPPHTAAVGEPGEFLLPVGPMLEALRASSISGVVFSMTDDDPSMLQVGGQTKWAWKVLPASQFPAIASWEASVVYTLPRQELVRLLRLVKPAAASGASKASLEQVGIRKGQIIAADGIRFHSVTFEPAAQMDVALPLPFVDDLLAVLANVPMEEIQLGIPEDGQALILRAGPLTMMSRVWSEPFPDIAQAFLIPAMSNHVTAKVDLSRLTTALRRVGVLADPEVRAVRLDLSGFSSLKVSTRQRVGSWAEEEIPVEWNGSDRTLVFNLDYFQSVLALFDGGTINLRVGPDQKHKPSPLLIQEGGRSAVLSQLRVEWL